MAHCTQNLWLNVYNDAIIDIICAFRIRTMVKLYMKQILNNIVYPVLMTALLVEQILPSLDRTVSQSSCPVSFRIIFMNFFVNVIICSQ